MAVEPATRGTGREHDGDRMERQRDRGFSEGTTCAYDERLAQLAMDGPATSLYARESWLCVHARHQSHAEFHGGRVAIRPG